ncbi:hypothetical protein PIB30_049794 [Stylosanthes scabra]|uniref:Uncharacterized protein n=1 Tax=Stylosanthes scabra TaxID=79078 RepID=A0ABU6QHN7_9FABA|nr:hypothetical protein [Stylosanthes scabra]
MPRYKCGEAEFGVEVARVSERNEMITTKPRRSLLDQMLQSSALGPGDSKILKSSFSNYQEPVREKVLSTTTTKASPPERACQPNISRLGPISSSERICMSGIDCSHSRLHRVSHIGHCGEKLTLPEIRFIPLRCVTGTSSTSRGSCHPGAVNTNRRY